MSFKKSALVVFSLILALSLVFAGCTNTSQDSTQTNQEQNSQENKTEENKLSGAVEIDGSSTVFPITEAIAEEFQKLHKDVKVTVGVSGTGGGFKRFTTGETDISNASRPIKEKEAATAKENNIEYTVLTVAYDGLSVLVNPSNDFVNDLTVEELKKIWEPGSKVKTWKDVRPEWPAEEIKLYGPGPDSGTFDYFTEEILGETGKIRTDYTASEDDNVLVQGIAGDKNALGFFGYAYYVENTDKLKAVAINGVKPEPSTIESGEYSPLSRPIFIYVSHNSLKEKPQVREFVKYYLENAKAIVPTVGYIALPDSKYDEQMKKLEEIVK